MSARNLLRNLLAGTHGYPAAVRLLIPIVVLVLALAAAVSLDRPLPRADFILIDRADVYTLDPQRMSYQQELRRARVIYETLVNLRAEDCEIIPGVAERWEVSPDGLTYTFHLRADARWSNGDPVTSADFVYSWRRALLPDSAADYSALFFAIRGARAFFEARDTMLKEFAAKHAAAPSAEAAKALWRQTVELFDTTVGLAAPDPRTFVVSLHAPVPYFLDNCAFPCFSPVHPATVDAFVSIDPATGRLIQRHDWTKPGRIVVNGPYMPTVWRYKRDMRLEPNPHYWNKGSLVAKSIECRTYENPNTAVLSLQSGAADWLTDLGPEYKTEMLAERQAYLARFKADIDAGLARGGRVDDIVGALPPPGTGERRDVRSFNAFGTDFFSFNCRPELPGGRLNPFHDARVRRAFALAIDKQTLIDRITRLNERVASTLVPHGSIPGYPKVDGLGYDTDRARAELKAAGWEDRDGDGVVENADGVRFPTVDILYSTSSPRYMNLALAMRDMWKRELRVAAECRGKDSKLYRTDLKDGNFMIARGGWYGDYGDPTTWLDLQQSQNGNNDRGYKSPEFDRRLQEANAEPDAAKRLVRLAEVERWLFTEEVPLMPICTYVTVYMYDPSVTRGITDHPRLEQDLSVIGPRSGVQSKGTSR